MPRRRRPLHAVAGAIVIALLLLNLGAITLGLRLATSDDMAIQRALSNPFQDLTNRIHDERIGRIYTEQKFFLLNHLMGLHSDALQSTLRVLACLLTLAAASWFVREWLDNGRAAFLTLVVSVGLFPIVATYQAFLSYPLLWLGWAAVWAMGAISLRTESLLGRCLLVSAFSFALWVHEGNAAFVILPLLVRGARGRPGWLSAAWRELLPCLAVLGAYGGLSLALRHFSAVNLPHPPYWGTALSANVRESGFALNVYTWSGLPGLNSWFERWRSTPWLTPLEWTQRIGHWITLPGLFASCLLSAAVWFGARRSARPQGTPREQGSLRFAAVLLYAAIAPNLLLAFTTKYQIWAHQRGWPYYYTSMSYSAWVVLIVGFSHVLMARIRNIRRERLVRALVAAGAVLLALGVNAANRQSVALLRQHPFTYMGDFKSWIEHLPGRTAPRSDDRKENRTAPGAAAPGRYR